MSNEPTAILARSDREQVRVMRQTFRGRDRVDVRIWFLPDGQTEYAPCRKGVSVPLEQIPELVAALQAAAAL